MKKSVAWLALVVVIAASDIAASAMGGSPAMADGLFTTPSDGTANGTLLRRFSHVSCDMVRAFVSEVGLVQARAMALAAGMTPAQERRAARCLDKKI